MRPRSPEDTRLAVTQQEQQMNVIDLHAFRVARAIRENIRSGAGLSSNDQPGLVGSYVVRLPNGADLEDPEDRAAAIKAHRERTGWTGPVVIGPPELTAEEWTAKYERNEEHSSDMKSSNYIRFQVSFDDGRISYFSTPRHDLRTGDHVARIIAREHQERGDLPAGKIVDVRRDPQN